MQRFAHFARLAVAGLTLGACRDAIQPLGPGSAVPPSLSAYPVGPPTERSIQDFLNAQGTFCFPDGLGGCVLFDPPVPNFLWFKQASTLLCAAVDYAGLAAAYIAQTSGGAISLGTTFEGTVTEVPLSNGHARVTVRLRTDRALTYVSDDCVGQVVGARLFGYSPAEVLAGQGSALGESLLQVVLVNSAPGAPLPDLIQAAFLPTVESRIVSLAVTASAQGPLRAAFGVPEGTLGSLRVTLVNLPATSVPDAFPVNRVDLHVIER